MGLQDVADLEPLSRAVCEAATCYSSLLFHRAAAFGRSDYRYGG